MKSYKISVLLLIMYLSCSIARAQEEESTIEEKRVRHSVGLSIAHAHISQGIRDGDRKWITEPSIMIDYNYIVTDRWSIGLHSDLIIQTFKVQKILDKSIIERSYPYCLVGVVGYKPVEHLTIVIGGGVELEEEENFGVIRISIEPSIEISERWEMPISLTYDAKIDGYDTWSFGIGVARMF